MDKTSKQLNPSRHAEVIATYTDTTSEQVQHAIDRALEVKPAWESMSFTDRAAVFLKTAELLSTKYRYEIMALSMRGQGKNAWQAEIDAAAELCDFLRSVSNDLVYLATALTGVDSTSSTRRKRMGTSLYIMRLVFGSK